MNILSYQITDLIHGTSNQQCVRSKNKRKFCDVCKIWISKSNSTQHFTKIHKNIVVNKLEKNPFALTSISEFKTILKSAKPQFENAKPQILQKRKTLFLANVY